MNKRWIVIIGVILLALAIGAIVLFSPNKKDSPKSTAVAKAQYYCPMHKEYVSDKPGNCPICSMKLVKKEGSPEEEMKKMLQESKGAQTQSVQTTMTEATASSATVFISPERQQLLGVRSVPAEYKIISTEIRTVGKIAYDETRITQIHTKFNGWIEQVFVNFVGEPVRKGQALFTIYSPELVSTQEEYLLALKSREKLKDSSFDWISKSSNSLADSAKERLKLWGISEEEIQKVVETGKTRRTLSIHSPVNGIVTQRAAYQHGTYLTPEMSLYTIVDISNVWLIADIYEKDLPFIKTGQKVTFELPYTNENKTIESRIDFFYPYLNPATRTGQVRIQLKNPGNQFKPDQFLNVFIKGDEQKHLVVPRDAVLNTGERQYVFVDLGNGYFEPREIRTGMETSEAMSVQEGLKEGERVVTASNFLLDSEARLRGVLENMGKPTQGMQLAKSANNLNIQMIESKTAKTGDNDFKVSVKDLSGQPITGAEVEITLFMPQMGSMPPMTSKGILLDRGNGIYEGVLNIPMAWTWETTITIRKDGTVLGSLKTSVTAR